MTNLLYPPLVAADVQEMLRNTLLKLMLNCAAQSHGNRWLLRTAQKMFHFTSEPFISNSAEKSGNNSLRGYWREQEALTHPRRPSIHCEGLVQAPRVTKELHHDVERVVGGRNARRSHHVQESQTLVHVLLLRTNVYL